VLPQHALAEEHQRQQADRERGLHDDEGGEQQRHDLQREAEHRQPGPREPACASQQPERKRRAQVLGVRSLLGVERLQRDA